MVTLTSPALAQTPEPAAEPAQAPPAVQAAEPKAPPPAPAAEAKPTPSEAKPPPAEPQPTAPVPAAPAPAPKPAPAAAAPAPTAAPAPAPKPQAAPPAPAAAAAPVPEKKDDAETYRREQVKSEARFILENLITGDARRAAGELTYPFQLEDKRYNTPEELVAAWVKQLRTKRTDLMNLYDIEVLSMAEMEKKYGKPPARLGLGSLRDPDIYLAVGNLSGHAAILLFRAPIGTPPKAFAYTD
ncbi:hypothetical protein DB31_5023 [Hyalangium minutum]|uniref:Uncharacterized protein n=2 Tax=Hyalangium minutum TaxID=394096 RepID=A0A085WQL8_9BACT|nr:hypothetical protein DB31_5023 [Hyalangium minutum]